MDHRYIFLAFGGDSDPHLERVLMDGSERIKFKVNVTNPVGLSIDYTEKMLYWFDRPPGSFNSINWVDFDGIGSGTTHFFTKTSYFPFHMNIVDDWIYWSDRINGTINQIKKSDIHEATTLFETLESELGQKVTDIFVYDKNRKNDNNICRDNHERCKLCLYKGHNKSSCYCDYGKLKDGAMGCEVPKLLLSTPNSVQLYDLESNQTIKNISLNKTVLALAYVANGDTVFWLTNDSINYANITDYVTGMENKLELDESPVRSLTVDWISQRLYWTESSSLISYDLISNNKSWLPIPFGYNNQIDIKVDPYNSNVFWVNETGVLMKSAINYLNSTELFVLSSQKIDDCNCTTQVNVSSLVIDHTNASSPQLYFFAMPIQLKNTTEIWKSDVNGCICSRVIQNIQNPRSLTVDAQYLYWIDEEGLEKVLYRAPKNFGRPIKIELRADHILTFLTYASYLQPLPENKCLNYTGVSSLIKATCSSLSLSLNFLNILQNCKEISLPTTNFTVEYKPGECYDANCTIKSISTNYNISGNTTVNLTKLEVSTNYSIWVKVDNFYTSQPISGPEKVYWTLQEGLKDCPDD